MIVCQETICSLRAGVESVLYILSGSLLVNLRSKLTCGINFLLQRSEKGLESFKETLKINNHMALEGLKVLNDHLERSEYLCGVHFSLADIIVGWTINWARRGSLISSFGRLNNYLDRLFERSHCVLAR